MSRHPRRAVVGIASRDQCLLAVKRSVHVIAPGKICFPGGGIESAESSTQALRREFREELDVDVVPDQQIWSSISPWGVHLEWWTVTLVDDVAIQPNPDEIEWHRWMAWEEMANHPQLLASNQLFFATISSDVVFDRSR